MVSLFIYLQREKKTSFTKNLVKYNSDVGTSVDTI